MENQARTNILSKLRMGRGVVNDVSLPVLNSTELYSDIPKNHQDACALFSEKLSLLKGEPHLCRTHLDAANILLELLSAIEASHCLVQRTPLFEDVVAANRNLAQKLSRAQSNFDQTSKVLSEYQVGISACDFLVARTGSVCLNTLSAGGRRLSVLPEFHIVLAYSDQMINSLTPWLEDLQRSEGSSYGVLITGPSRTSDIEKILVLGAHGPKRLAVIVVDRQN